MNVKQSLLITLFLTTLSLKAGLSNEKQLIRFCLNNNTDETLYFLSRHPGIDFDYIDKSGRTALHIAATKGNIIVVEKLLTLGADPNIPCLTFGYPYLLFIALQQQNMDLLRLLSSQPTINFDIVNPAGYTPLDLAVNMGSNTALEILAQSGANPNTPNMKKKEGTFPLHSACEKGNVAAVRILLEGKIKPNLSKRNKSFNTAFEVARELPDEEKKDAILELLTEAMNNEAMTTTTPYDHINRVGRTALYIAATANNTIKVENLLTLGADPNIPNVGSGAPYLLFTAILHQNMLLLRLLSSQPTINFDVITPLGYTPLDLAVNVENNTALRILAQSGANPNTPNVEQRTFPLHRACQKGNVTAVKILLEGKIKPNLFYRNGDYFNAFEVAKKLPDGQNKDAILELLTEAMNNEAIPME